MIATKGVLFTVLAQLCKGGADRHSSMPALSHVKIETNSGTARLTATDLTTTLTSTIPASGTFEGCLPVRPLAEFVKPEARSDRETCVEFKSVENGQVVVASEGAITTLSSLPTKDFPLRPGDKHPASEWRSLVRWDAAEFAAKVGWVLLAVGLDETRRHLTGVLFNAEGVVALDGHRLHMASLPAMADRPILVPGQAVAALLHLLPKKGGIAVSHAKQALRFTVGEWELETLVMAEKFPPYEQVIPGEREASVRAVIDRDRLVRALSKMPKKGSKRSQSMRMKLNGSLELSVDTDDRAASVALPLIESDHRGADFTIGVNPNYIADALDQGPEAVTVRFYDELSPIRLDLGADRLAVVMPMRL